MVNTAIGAESKTKTYTITFKDEAHEKFYKECLPKCRYQDVYHKALVDCLGISEDARRNVSKIYDFKTGCVKTECLREGWITSGSAKIVRMAFNLYCNSSCLTFHNQARFMGNYKSHTEVNHYGNVKFTGTYQQNRNCTG